MTTPTDQHSPLPAEFADTAEKPKLEWGFLASGPWIGGLVFCIIFAIGCYFLGDWQMNRRMQVLEEVNKVIENYDADPVSYEQAGVLFTDFEESKKWTPVLMSGTYDADETVYVRNRPRAGQVGYEVLVPFDVTNGERILINRGWVAAGEDANGPDDVPQPPQGEAQIIARVVPEEDTINRDAPDGQVASINLPLVNDQLETPVVEGAYGRMAAEAPEPELQPQQLPEPEKDEGPHLSYSLQWFTFGLMSFVVWGYLARLQAVQNREDKMYGLTEEQGYMSAHRIPRQKKRKRRRDGSKTDEEIEDEMFG